MFLPEAEAGRFFVERVEVSVVALLQHAQAFVALVLELQRLLVHLLLKQRPAHADAVLELLALAVALRLRLHFVLALVRQQHLHLVVQTVL